MFYLDHSNDFSGGQKSLLITLKLLDRERFNPIVIIDRRANKMAQELASIDIVPIRINYFNKRMIEYFLVVIPIILIWWNMRTKKCSLLHCNTFKTGFMGSIISLFVNTPLVFRARLGIIHLSHGLIDKIIFKRSDLILANSLYVKETFEQRFGTSQKVIVVYNPLENRIELNPKPIAAIREKYFAEPSLYYFGLVGRIELFKNLHDVVEAVRILCTRQQNFRVLFIGSASKLDLDNYPQQLRSLIKKYQLGKFFEFTGFVSEIHEITSLLNCVIICSKGEALSRGIYESQALGVPVIGSNSGGNPELILHGQTGLLFDVEDPDSLASQMESLMTDPHLQSLVSENARVHVKKLFQHENTIVNEMNAYEKIIQSRS